MNIFRTIEYDHTGEGSLMEITYEVNDTGDIERPELVILDFKTYYVYNEIVGEQITGLHPMVVNTMAESMGLFLKQHLDKELN